jgi:SAM-dependent methyltransferase
MSKSVASGSGQGADAGTPGYRLPSAPSQDWQTLTAAVAQRYNREYQRQAVDLPPEVESMPLFHDWAAGTLPARIASPFWELIRPQKNQHILDLGCGLSFLIYPCWREWPVYFHGQEISTVAQEAINSRGPQMNSKFFKGVQLGGAEQIKLDNQPLDWIIATGWSCYYPLDYWKAVLGEVKRVLKPGGQLVFDVIDPELELAENWAIFETYLGAEVFLHALSDWEALLKTAGAKIAARQPGELFQLYRVGF